MIKNLVKKLLPVTDALASPLVLISAYIMLLLRKTGVQRLPVSKNILNKLGVFPIRDHYHEPMFNPIYLRKSLREDRDLMAIDFNLAEQLTLLDKFNYNDELEQFPMENNGDGIFYYNNGYFESGDAEYLYNIIRLYKPARIIEVGGGYSTLMAINALKKNKEENKDYECKYICIEPYERPWLENLGVRIIRDIVERVDKALFTELDRNDILFIDSSHIIRPQGDVLFAYLEVFPILKPGVLVHIHDIFTPKDYQDEWVIEEVILWNEQYLLEAFLSFNKEYRILGALNYLKHHYPDKLEAKCPILKRNLESAEPGSFWLARN